MRRVALHFPTVWKAGFGGVLAWSWLTGVSFFALHRWFQMEGDFGPEKHPLEPWLIKAHGAGAFLSLIAFGYLMASHIPTGWKTKRSRKGGLTLVAVLSGMVITGYGLYYLGDEAWRSAAAWVHLALGFSFPFLLAAHIVSGRRRVT